MNHRNEQISKDGVLKPRMKLKLENEFADTLAPWVLLLCDKFYLCSYCQHMRFFRVNERIYLFIYFKILNKSF